MELTVLTGDDDLAIRTRRKALLDAAGGDAERIDVAADGGMLLVDAVCSPSMFGGRRVVAAEGLEAISEGNLEALTRNGSGSDAVVVARVSGALTPKQREALKKLGTVQSLTTPKGKGVGMRVDELIDAAGIRLTGDLRKLLVERAGHDLDRLSSILKQLQIAGIGQPTRAQLDLLLGTTAAPGVPWTLSDALETGDVAGMLAAAKGLEPIPAVAYLASRNAQLGRVVDAGIPSVEDTMKLLGVAHRFQAEKIVRLARKVGSEGVKESWDVLVAADRAVKVSKHPGVELDLLLTRLVRIWR